MNAPNLADWIGRTRTEHDVATISPMRGLASLLDRDPDTVSDGDALPPCAYWLYFLPFVRQSGIGTDGHPHRGGFLPPVELPRRMWAGSSLELGEPVRIGDAMEKRSTIVDVQAKDGRSGRLTFVTVGHEISGPSGLALREKQDIVYREPSGPGTGGVTPPAPPLPAFDHDRSVAPDPVSLFRYSALTFNGHRIHYDRDYATGEEGYRDLVVHGPFVATLLAELAADTVPGRRMTGFSWRGKRPAFCGDTLTLGASLVDRDTLSLLAAASDGVTMEARAVFAAM